MYRITRPCVPTGDPARLVLQRRAGLEQRESPACSHSAACWSTPTAGRDTSPQSAIPIACLIVFGSSTARSMKSATSAREIDNPRRRFRPNAIR